MYIIYYFEELMLEWLIKLIHPSNISVKLEIFHFDKSGNDINELHPSNIKLISLTLDQVMILMNYIHKTYNSCH